MTRSAANATPVASTSISLWKRLAWATSAASSTARSRKPASAAKPSSSRARREPERMGVPTSPFFVVSSGRSGTAMMERLFSCFPQVEMHHEYMVHHVQPAAVKYHMGLIGLGEATHALRATHGAAVHYSESPIWGDSSNKLSWLIPVLDRMFPD